MTSDADLVSRTAADFASFLALILGDPFCGGFPPVAADTNKAVWSAAATGNVVVVGTDPSVHPPGGTVVTSSGIAFAAAAPTTGAYITLACYYHGTTPLTPVPFLDGLGSFTVTGVGCYNDSHIVAVSPALIGLTDASLSGWSCSVHEAFDSFPTNFLPLAIAENIGCDTSVPPLPTNPPGTAIAFADGTCGTPYILARGAELSPVACGDGTLDVSEECDDGNVDNGDGCSAQCTIEIPTGPVCGDGVVEAPEACDDGNILDGDGCSSVCTIESGKSDKSGKSGK